MYKLLRAFDNSIPVSLWRSFWHSMGHSVYVYPTKGYQLTRVGLMKPSGFKMSGREFLIVLALSAIAVTLIAVSIFTLL